ncbi:sigma-70 family RNA polymerase sigma factor [Paenibacillus hamazuiensis]|uniref:sigma-70 family RNA polymerase sigma factor n=1 Tax=Paenibacillus hamazuiensis TaxID=2936508 RepID=UPI00200ED7C7|nr:sigma-70 family RNA polymerase sigma factor [Paenibacillus hamazuiensis]
MTTLALDIQQWKNICKNEFEMDPNDVPVPQNRLTKTELNRKRSQLDEFLSGNSRFTEYIVGEVKDTPFLLAITDHKGFLLKMYCDTTMGNLIHKMGITEGVQFREQDAGINSISMSVRFQEAVKITGNEHFHYCLQDKSCFSIPLRLSHKEIGTFSIMTFAEHMGNNLLQLITSSVKKAEQIRTTHEFYELYNHDVYRYLCYLTKDKEIAKDLSQQTFLSIFNGIESFKQESSPKSWIYRIAHNTFVSWYRKERKLKTLHLDEHAQFIQTQFHEPHRYAEIQWQLNEVIEHISKLKPDYQEVIYLREFKQLSYQEISDCTGWSNSNIKTMLYRARNKLKILIEKANIRK